MRVIVGVIAGLGLVVTVAVAQPPVERAAVLKPPIPLPPDQMPPVARGVADGFPPTASAAALASTPITRPNAPPVRNMPGIATGTPAWLNGGDPTVLPAAGTSTKSVNVRPLTPVPTGIVKDEALTQPKFLDRLKGTNSDKQPAPLPPQLQQHAQFGQPETATANTSFRATGANGAPVYAGPPAYRWYGWGTVTPGANPLAPAGQYPKASANWYSITGATPGAFPVPATNDTRIVPGIEPPTYGLARANATTPAVSVTAQQSWPQQQPTYKTWQQRPEVPTKSSNDSKFQAGSGIGSAMPGPNVTPPPALAPAPVSVPTIIAPPMPPVAVSPPMPPVPTISPVPIIPPVPMPDPVAVLPPLPAIPIEPADPVVPPMPPVVPSVEPAKIALPTAEPKPLPTSVTTDPPREEYRWQTTPEPTTLQPGTWMPAQGAQPLPTQPMEQPPSGPSGSATVRPVVARGQMNDRTPDPIGALIKQMCQGRANSVEVRWTGTKKLQVCFEIRTATEAQKLVTDISKRPELTTYQIDFCALVK